MPRHRDNPPPVVRFSRRQSPHEHRVPWDKDAELAVLGTILIETTALTVASTVLQPTDFWLPEHGWIFEAMQSVAGRSEPVEFISVKNELARRRRLDAVGGPAYISSLADGVPRATNVAYYAKRVRERALRRHLIEELNQQIEQAYGDVELEDIAGSHRRACVAMEALEHHERAASAKPLLMSLEDVPEQHTEWLWTGRLAVGEMMLLVGNPGVGKTWVGLDVVARVTRGQCIAGDTSRPPLAPMNAAVFTSEMRGHRIRERVIALDGDISRVRILNSGADGESLQLSHTKRIERVMLDEGVKVLVLDPVTTFMGRLDNNNEAEVRAALERIIAMARRTGTAIVGLMHVTKDAHRRAPIARALGSIAFTAVPRATFEVVDVPAERRGTARGVMRVVKVNESSEPDPTGFTIIKKPRPRFAWDTDPLAVGTLRSLEGNDEENDVVRRVATEFLQELLNDPNTKWPLGASETLATAAALGIKPASLHRARVRLGVGWKKNRRSGRYVWFRPKDA